MRGRLLSKAQNCQNLKTCIKAPFKNLIANASLLQQQAHVMSHIHGENLC